MAEYLKLWEEEKGEIKERRELVMGRIAEILKEQDVEDVYKDYFAKLSEKILFMNDILSLGESREYFNLSLEELQANNEKLYKEFREEAYESNYGNPAYAVKMFGEEYGTILAFLYTRIATMAPRMIAGISHLLIIYAELFVQIYNRFEEKDLEGAELRKIIVEFFHDYVEYFVGIGTHEMLDPKWDIYTDIVDNADLNDLRYLYFYGLNVTENEIKVAEFFKNMDEAEIQAMADTYTEGFCIGYKKMGKELEKKSGIGHYYAIGFERMIRLARRNFKKLGINGLISSAAVSTTSANRQWDFDHREDLALYLDKAYAERYLETRKVFFEQLKKEAAGYAGPAVIETFGEKNFDPVIKKEAARYNDKQREVDIYLKSQNSQLSNKYINPEERSFTIISYPIPEIGDRFEEIFEETVKVNTLDYKTYEEIQAKIIDVLDTADHVLVKGCGENKTDLMIKIHPLNNPEKESAFENCVADVNIPVGEVFTSPVLKGTNGLLHVTEVYLNGLKVKDLEIELTDGMISRYTCGNFDSEEENKKFMSDSVMFNHETLPIGEFAIGTNTTAYKMGIEYDIQAKLPILIAEKTGPHFAMGDTCYSRSENVKVFNPDGKEIVAKDNEVSLLRDVDMSKAYYNCHTDITIPYNELDYIKAVAADGTVTDVIVNGRFVIPGTEELNVPLDEME